MTRGVCTETDFITINVNSRPVILSIEETGTRDRTIIHDPGAGSPPFQFGVDNRPVDDDPLKINLFFGMHSFYIIDVAGCRSDATDLLVEAPKLFIPPYFSPNGDGIMDRWDIPGMNEIYPNAVVTIYDRNGKELVKYSGSEQGWDGTYLGREMPTTDYWYIIDIEEINKQYVGHFTLLRK
jgi:gliding motility-associated-like protein